MNDATFRRVGMAQVGEGFVGDVPHVAHINTVLGARGGPVETAWATALATPSAGHVPFVCVLQPNLPVQPMTLFVNKASVVSELHGNLTWGAAQAGVAAGVADAVSDGVIDASTVNELLLICAVWVDPNATDEGEVFNNNRAATLAALTSGLRGDPAVERVLSERDSPWNPYFLRYKPT
jgi:5,6,7,8-tetrahydromethanopterin hydro-lyase